MDHKCNSCFYMQHERDKHPCNTCQGYDKHVNRNIYIHQPLSQSIKTWDYEDAFDEDTSDGYYGGSEDYVEKANEAIHSPKHYTTGNFEVIDVIEDWGLNFRLANVIKYIARHEHKGKPLEDLEKALWYLQREISLWKSPSKN